MRSTSHRPGVDWCGNAGHCCNWVILLLLLVVLKPASPGDELVGRPGQVVVRHDAGVVGGRLAPEQVPTVCVHLPEVLLPRHHQLPSACDCLLRAQPQETGHYTGVLSACSSSVPTHYVLACRCSTGL